MNPAQLPGDGPGGSVDRVDSVQMPERQEEVLPVWLDRVPVLDVEHGPTARKDLVPPPRDGLAEPDVVERVPLPHELALRCHLLDLIPGHGRVR